MKSFLECIVRNKNKKIKKYIKILLIYFLKTLDVVFLMKRDSRRQSHEQIKTYSAILVSILIT